MILLENIDFKIKIANPNKFLNFFFWFCYIEINAFGLTIIEI